MTLPPVMGEKAGTQGIITMRCPQCDRRQIAAADASDPPGTDVVETLCDRCDDGSGFPETNYFDADGKQLEVP